MHDALAQAVDPMNCAVGRTTCANICPTGAISFPALDAIWKLERERQIFRTVKKESQKKHEREGALKAREAAQKAMGHMSTRAKVEVAGEFGEKKFLVRLEQLVEGRPFDIVNLRLEVPTVLCNLRPIGFRDGRTAGQVGSHTDKVHDPVPPNGASPGQQLITSLALRVSSECVIVGRGQYLSKLMKSSKMPGTAEFAH